MAAATTWDRRSLFRGSGWAEALAAFTHSPQARRSELIVARRAMACEFSVIFPLGIPGAVEAGYTALDEVERLEQKLSVYHTGSDLSFLNGSAPDGPVRVDAELYAILKTAARLAAATGGAFDAATGALIRAWGFFGGPRRVPPENERLAALQRSGSSHVRFSDQDLTVAYDRPGIEFNLGAIGKGFAIDCALARIRRECGIRNALMQGGQSSLRALGTWTVDIGAIARVTLRDQAMGTSGSDRQYFVDEGRHFGHILDPRTGRPASGLTSATAIARTAAEADALSTAFFVMGKQDTRAFCRKHPEVTAVLADVSGRPEIIGDADVKVLK